MEFFSSTSYDLLEVERPKLCDFFINAFQDSCESDILDDLLEIMDQVTEDESLHITIIAVVKRLLQLCTVVNREKHHRVDVCTMIFQFLVYYPGVFDWVCDHPRFLETTVEKLKELACERREGIMVKGGRPFLEDETRDMAMRLLEKGELEKAATLEALLN